MTTSEDLLADVVWFLNNTLATEELSPSANQRRLLLLQKILSKDSIAFPYVDMSGCHKSLSDFESPGECYEELESSWSGSGGSSSASRNYSNTLPGVGRHQRFSFFFGNGLCESKNAKEVGKNCVDTTDFPNDCSKRNSVLSDSDNSLSPSSVKSEDSLEVMTISASAIKYSAIKCGALFRKEKVLFVEHSKRLWVALLGTTLYVYTSEKDVKPIYSINVDEYTARPIAVSHASKKEFGFEIVCPGKKTYQFYSNSKSDMETWILSINHSMPLPQTSSVIAAISSGSMTPGIVDVTNPLEMKLTECSTKRNYRDSVRYENADNIADRELPSLPMYLHYDTPNPICRAVVPESKRGLLDNLIQETFYHSIDESLAEQLARYDYPIRKDPVLRNKENIDKNYNPEDNVYYNILDHIRQRGINENASAPSDSTTKSSCKDEEKENVCHKNGISRIRQLIQKMEEINNQNNSPNKNNSSFISNNSKLNSPTSRVNEDIYELVNSPTYVNINA